LASFAETPIKDNYEIKRLLAKITKILNKQISRMFLKHMHYCIAIFLILHLSNKNNMDSLGIHEEIEGYYNPISILTDYSVGHSLYYIQDNLRYEFLEVLINFEVSSLVIPALVRDYFLKPIRQKRT